MFCFCLESDRTAHCLNKDPLIVSECCDRLKAVSVLLNNGMLQTVYIYSSPHGTLDFFASLD